jgi:hypothetical protein
MAAFAGAEARHHHEPVIGPAMASFNPPSYCEISPPNGGRNGEATCHVTTELRLANENNAGQGQIATVTGVDFSIGPIKPFE